MTMLDIEAGDQRLAAEPTRAYVIGRGPVADVRLDHPSVSRHHADVMFDGETWIFIDRSSAGSYVNGESISQLPIAGPITIRLGPVGAPEIELAPRVVWQPPAVDVFAEHSQAGTIAFTDHALRLDFGESHAAFAPGARVVVGRGADCDLRTDDQLVSSRHCVFTHNGQHWVLEDLGSTRGTFIDGRKVSKPTPIQGALIIGLGDESVGAELRAVTSGVHEPPKDRRFLGLGLAVAVAMILLVVAGIALWPDGRTGPNSDAQLERAKAATVFIYTESPDVGAASGSGVFVSNDLVLTNRHVAEGADLILLAVSDGEDTRVDYRYRVEHIASHPYLDLALVRVIETIEVTDAGFDVVPDIAPPSPLAIGSSADLRIGEGLNSLGFPNITSTGVSLPAVTVSEGEIATFQEWPGCDNSSVDVLLVPGGYSQCAPGGDLDRGNLLSSDLSGSGGSGGPIVVDGKIVAVRYAGRGADQFETTGAQSTAGVAISIPIEFALEWLDEQL